MPVPVATSLIPYFDDREEWCQTPVRQDYSYGLGLKEHSRPGSIPVYPQNLDEMALPDIRRAQSTAPSYERQLRSGGMMFPPTPQHQSYQDDFQGYVVDDAAGVPSVSYFRKAYTVPRNRNGRAGGSWRHISQVTGQSGSNLLFIEGLVKDHDVRSFPPFGIRNERAMLNTYGQRLIPRQSMYNQKSNPFNSRAKKGFEYWYKEPQINISRKNTGAIGSKGQFTGLPMTTGPIMPPRAPKATQA